jgi:hypothetical protein
LRHCASGAQAGGEQGIFHRDLKQIREARMRAWWVAVLVALAATSASASRSLDEPGAIARQVKRAPRAEIKAALKAAGLEKACPNAVLYAPGMVGLRCRLTVLAHEAARAEDTAAGLKSRLELARLAEHAAASLSAYKPLRRVRSFDGERAAAHEQACRVLLVSHDAVRGLPADSPLDQDRTVAMARFGRDERGLSYAACSCVARSLELVPPDAEAGKRGALQGEMTSRACFLDKGAVTEARGGPKTAFSGRAAAVAAEATVEASFKAYAESRAFELKRCLDKHAPYGRVKKKEKLSKCACRAVKRWRFPADRERKDVGFDLPLIGEKVKLATVINPAGKVAACGPLRE